MEMELLHRTETYGAEVDGKEYTVNIIYYDSACTYHVEVLDEEGNFLNLKDIPEEIKEAINKEYPEVGI